VKKSEKHQNNFTRKNSVTMRFKSVFSEKVKIFYYCFDIKKLNKYIYNIKHFLKYAKKYHFFTLWL